MILLRRSQFKPSPALPLVACGLLTLISNLWLFPAVYFSPLILLAWLLRERRESYPCYPGLSGIVMGLFSIMACLTLSQPIHRAQGSLFPVQGFGPYMALSFVLETTLIGAPLVWFTARRYGTRPAFLLALGFLAPTAAWAFWDISYGAPPLQLPAHRLEIQLPGLFMLLLAFLATVAIRTTPRKLRWLVGATFLLTTAFLALSGILARGWLPPGTQFGFDPALAPRYLLIYGIGIGSLLLPLLTNPHYVERNV